MKISGKTQKHFCGEHSKCLCGTEKETGKGLGGAFSTIKSFVGYPTVEFEVAPYGTAGGGKTIIAVITESCPPILPGEFFGWIKAFKVVGVVCYVHQR